MKRAGIVLCGGLSSRMGRSKALLPWLGDQTMIQHVVGRLQPVVDEVIVVRSRELELPQLPAGARVVVDRESARGPLAGIRDGLAATNAASAFVTSTDAPFLTPKYVNALFGLAGEGACAPIRDGFVQVLSAIYPGSAHVEAQALLDAGKDRPRALLDSLSFRPFEVEIEGEAEAEKETKADERGREAWRGFNTPESYLSILREVDPQASAVLVLEPSGARVRVPVDTLGGVLRAGVKALGEPNLCCREGEAVADRYRVYLQDSGDTRMATEVKSLAIPIGLDEHVTLSPIANAGDPKRAVAPGSSDSMKS